MAKNLTFELVRASILAASRPETALRRIADLPAPLPSGVRAYLADAAAVTRHKGPSWQPVVDALTSLPFEPARSLTGCVCGTCMVSYQGRADKGGLGQVRTMPRTFQDKNGAPDPDTKGTDGEAYGPPARTDEDRYRPVFDAERGTWKGYILERQNACAACRGFDGEARVALLSGPDGLTAYREAVSAAWVALDEREAAAEAKRQERAASRGIPRAPRTPVGSKVAARLLANLDSLSDADREALVRALSKRTDGGDA